jgi:hypothetical protein
MIYRVRKQLVEEGFEAVLSRNVCERAVDHNFFGHTAVMN